MEGKWEELGFLDGLNILDKLALSKYFDDMSDYILSIPEDHYNDGEVIEMMAIAATRRIYLRGVKNIDPKDLCDSLYECVVHDLEKFKKYEDPMAELLSYFCNTYR